MTNDDIIDAERKQRHQAMLSEMDQVTFHSL